MSKNRLENARTSPTKTQVYRGVVSGGLAGIVAIAIETNERTQGYRKDYKCVSAVLPGTPWQEQCDRQTLDSFATYKHEATFPTAGRN